MSEGPRFTIERDAFPGSYRPHRLRFDGAPIGLLSTEQADALAPLLDPVPTDGLEMVGHLGARWDEAALHPHGTDYPVTPEPGERVLVNEEGIWVYEPGDWFIRMEDDEKDLIQPIPVYAVATDLDRYRSARVVEPEPALTDDEFAAFAEGAGFDPAPAPSVPVSEDLDGPLTLVRAAIDGGRAGLNWSLSHVTDGHLDWFTDEEAAAVAAQIGVDLPVSPPTEQVRLDQIPNRRLPGHDWPVIEFGFDPMDGYVAQGHPSDECLNPVAPFTVDPSGRVTVLVEDPS